MDRCDSSLPTVDCRTTEKERRQRGGQTGGEGEREEQFTGQHDDQVLKAPDAIIIILP